jgi:molecular chaperone GrpE
VSDDVTLEEGAADSLSVEAAAAAAVERDIAAVESDVDALLARLQDAEAKRDEYLDDLRRLAADFDNYRKRVLREQETLLAQASTRLVTRVLPVLDDLERALQAAEQHDEASVLAGVRMTKDALVGVLAAEGVEEIDTAGSFDPHFHEALMTQAADGVESGAIVQVVQRGYRVGEVVVRPARVVVAE